MFVYKVSFWSGMDIRKSWERREKMENQDMTGEDSYKKVLILAICLIFSSSEDVGKYCGLDKVLYVS